MSKQNNSAECTPVVFISPEAVKATQSLKRNPNDLIVMNAQTDLCGRKLAVIPVSEVDAEMPYQRTQTQQAIDKLIANWDADLYEPIRVIYRDGKFRAWDGGKRLAAQIKMGKTEVVCQICSVETMDADKLWHEEIKRFRKQSDCITKLRPVDMFRCNLADKAPLETMMKSVCDEYGVALKLDSSHGYSRKTKIISNISRFTGLAKNIGEDGIRWVFDTIHKMKMDREGYDGYNTVFLLALGELYRNPITSRAVIAEKLAAYQLEKPETNFRLGTKWFSWTAFTYKINARHAYPNVNDTEALVNFFNDIVLGLVKNENENEIKK